MSTQYEYDGDKLVVEYWNGNILYYVYDQNGSIAGMRYRKSSYAAGVFDEYLFEKNLQGDVVAVYDINGTKLVSYTYDAWGNFETTYHNGGGSTSARYNPFRYRGYYYDSDIGLYYLNTRYYSPELGRFISADSYINANGGLQGFNMYAYCNNNPVMYVDDNGQFAIPFWAKIIISVAVVVVAAVVVNEIVKSANYDNNSKNQELIPEGPINNQRDVDYMKMGFVGAGSNGCGWISVYNTMMLIGRPQKAADVIKYFDGFGRNFLYGALGANPIAISGYFEKNNVSYKSVALFGKISNDIENKARSASVCIILYKHDSGAHYTAFRWNGTEYITHNGSKKNFSSVSDYMSQVNGTPYNIWMIN